MTDKLQTSLFKMTITCNKFWKKTYPDDIFCSSVLINHFEN